MNTHKKSHLDDLSTMDLLKLAWNSYDPNTQDPLKNVWAQTLFDAAAAKAFKPLIGEKWANKIFLGFPQ